MNQPQITARNGIYGADLPRAPTQGARLPTLLVTRSALEVNSTAHAKGGTPERIVVAYPSRAAPVLGLAAPGAGPLGAMLPKRVDERATVLDLAIFDPCLLRSRDKLSS